MSTTRSSRSKRVSSLPAAVLPIDDDEEDNSLSAAEDEEDSSDDDEGEKRYILDGATFDSYQDYVDAKKRKNAAVIAELNLREAAASARQEAKRRKTTPQGGLSAAKRRKTMVVSERRKSNRLAGVDSDGAFLVEERAGKVAVTMPKTGVTRTITPDKDLTTTNGEEFYRGRINDGSPISIQEAVENTGNKWVTEESVKNAESLVRKTLGFLTSAARTSSTRDSTKDVHAMVQALNADDEDKVAKVVPDRIYSIAAHPSTNKLIVSAGDKQGYVGIWDVESRETENNGVHLFRFHSGAVNCLQWTWNGLFSTSYDGTVRFFDVASEKFQQVFATYDSTSEYKKELGYKLDTGYKFWTQYGCLDHRSNNEKAFFLSTSQGTAMHVDLRANKLSFHASFSEKKINTLSLAPNGYSLFSGGLDCYVKLWDIRKLTKKPLHTYNATRSVSSAFCSPSGHAVLATTMADKLDVLSPSNLKPTTQIKHDNKTGRWLSTFMATWHPELDIFVVGSMKQPRLIEVYDTKKELRAISGEALTAVASRCCFHPRSDKLVVVGGNSSGRVTVVT